MGDGWLWAVSDDKRGYRKDDTDHDLVIEDDYHVTHWAEIEWPE